MKSSHPRIREHLRKMPNGATVPEIARSLGLRVESARTALKAMPDVYIERWLLTAGGPPAAVWRAAHVPPHCPPPGD